ncbi:cytochrome P450 [Halenospora varia]|nr:cytochrome P450 [Halenospora varia]
MSSLLENRSPALISLIGLGVFYLLAILTKWAITARQQRAFAAKNGCKSTPWYPHKDPILGIDLFLKNLKLSQEGGFLEGVSARYDLISRRAGKPVYTFKQLLLGEPVILTCEPENVKAVLATKFKDFDLPPRRKTALGPIFGHGIFTTDGGEWEASRALLRPNFTRSQVGDIDIFEAHISKLIERIPKDGKTVDLQPLFFLLTLDSATEFLFGQSTDTLSEKEDDMSSPGVRFSDAFNYVTFKGGLEARVGKLAVLMPDKKYKEDVKFVHEYVGGYVDRALDLHKESLKHENIEEGAADKYIFLEELAKTGYPAKKIQDELLNILLAGRDTTASLLGFVFYYLARRPDVVEKLRAEVLQLGSGQPSFEDLKGMKYLQGCLNEGEPACPVTLLIQNTDCLALRLWPIVPANGRIAVRDTFLPLGGGADGKSPVFVKKGQSVLYQPYVMQRRKDLYGADANEFRPERWETLRPSWQYLPFNGGPRICIGQQFALIEASYAVVRILQTFKAIEKRDNSVLTEYLTLTACPRSGVKVGMTPA